LLTLVGIVMAFGMAALFEITYLKGDLGTLLIGVMLADSKKSKELYKNLIKLKDLFLVGFFLSIGLNGLPDWQALIVSAMLLGIMVFKAPLFFFLLAKGGGLRARVSFIASLSLTNYSEVGLIVIKAASDKGWVDSKFLVMMACALSASWVISSPLNAKSNSLFTSNKERLESWENPQDPIVNLDGVQAVVLGMGRVGKGVYPVLEKTLMLADMKERGMPLPQFKQLTRTKDNLEEVRAELKNFPRPDGQPEKPVVLGVDNDKPNVKRLQKLGRNILDIDASDNAFWERLKARVDDIKMIVVCFMEHANNLSTVNRIKEVKYAGNVFVICKFPDHKKELELIDLDDDKKTKNNFVKAYNLYPGAGKGFAQEVLHLTDGDADNDGKISDEEFRQIRAKMEAEKSAA